MRNKTKMVNEMSGKRSPKINPKTEQKKSKRLAVEKKKIVQKPKSIESQKENKKMKLALPIELREKINAEKDPEKTIAEAVAGYYAENRRRSDVSIQKEIDNNIIEVQRRHISDLKDQLTVANKNYEELMKTHQAYMLQVQPMIEAAQKKEIEAKKPMPERKTANENAANENSGKETTPAPAATPKAASTPASAATPKAASTPVPAAPKTASTPAPAAAPKTASAPAPAATPKAASAPAFTETSKADSTSASTTTSTAASKAPNPKKWYEFWK